jgi:hypothetical protein
MYETQDVTTARIITALSTKHTLAARNDAEQICKRDGWQ